MKIKVFYKQKKFKKKRRIYEFFLPSICVSGRHNVTSYDVTWQNAVSAKRRIESTEKCVENANKWIKYKQNWKTFFFGGKTVNFCGKTIYIGGKTCNFDKFNDVYIKKI